MHSAVDSQILNQKENKVVAKEVGISISRMLHFNANDYHFCFQSYSLSTDIESQLKKLSYTFTEYISKRP